MRLKVKSASFATKDRLANQIIGVNQIIGATYQSESVKYGLKIELHGLLDADRDTLGKALLSAVCDVDLKWIDIRDEQPEVGQHVIFVSIGGYVYGGEFDCLVKMRGMGLRGKFDIKTDYCHGTHWLPLDILPPLPTQDQTKEGI